MNFDYFISQPLSFIVILIFVVYLVTVIEYITGMRSIANLSDISPVKLDNYPKISIIIPARNEERKIESALASVLRQDYPDYEVTVINDRSVDKTGEILDRMASSNPALKVVHTKSLPKGWLGKNYALDFGAELSSGDYFIFSDADVVYAPDTLSRVVPYVIKNKTCHLSMIPGHVYKSFLLTAALCVFGFMFMVKFKPWRVKNPKSKYFIGVGSFNMIKASVYKETGGFKTLKMRPDDDIMLGKLVKKSGFSSRFVLALENLKIEWYHSLGEMIGAFYKNTYAGFNYNPLNVIFSLFMLILLCIFPYISIFFVDSIGLIFNLGILLLIFIVYLGLYIGEKINVLYYFTYPLAGVIMLYLILRAVLLTVANGGIDWRGTFYSLKELKSNKV